MGDHTGKDVATQAIAGTGAGAGMDAFWAGVAQGTSAPLIDPRVPGKTPDASAMLPWVDDDHHAGSSKPQFWGDDLRQEEFERRRKRDAVMETRRSQHANELQGIPAAYRIEEQVVGSTHRFVVARPRITNDLKALVTPSIRSADSRAHGFTPRMPAAGMFVLGKDVETEIAIELEPQHAGPVTADLVLEIRWTDGSVDVRTITLHASARLRTEIPEKQVPVTSNAQFRETAEFATPTTDPHAPAPSVEQKTSATNEFHQLVSDVRQAAHSLADRQVDGVNVSSDEADSYTRKPPETSLFYDLMELAVSMGVAGVAGVLARRLGTGLAARFGSGERSSLALGFTDAFKEGMKRIGNSATVKRATVEKLPGGPEKHAPDEAVRLDDEVRRPASTNGRIAFFAEQTEMLRDLVDQNQALIAAQSRKLMPLLETHPEEALAALRALDQAFSEATSAARDFQAHASSLQWVSAVARSSLGSTSATTHDRSYSRHVSNMQNHAVGSDGVLLIDVVRSGEELTVTGASIRGVSQEIADRLAANSLKDAPIPIRIQVSSGPATATIHLDEAKRMRVYGVIDPTDALPISEYVQRQNMPEQLEAQSTSRAEKIVASVLARPIGAGRIISDDASGRGDPK